MRYSPFTDPKSFIALSMALKGTGRPYYRRHKHPIQKSICAAEARHDGRASSAAPKDAAWNGPYDMALSVKLDTGQSRALALSLLGHHCGTTPPLGLLHKPHRRGAREDLLREQLKPCVWRRVALSQHPQDIILHEDSRFSFTVATI
ncbi:hypothetical protein BC835DRAFT_1424177 [Cytidiella melzeri]|nr:hypothetical protein BC835DRAFT_1424177 [Cytidiella melzeri]